MTWRKNTSDEIEDLRQFVEEMKRGRTPASGDSLVETLRQIHDKRETVSPSHEHRQMLLARLRREMAASAGTAPDEPARPVITLPVARPSFAVRYALAASLVAHIGLGAAALRYVNFNSSLVASVLATDNETIDARGVLWLPPLPPLPSAPASGVGAGPGDRSSRGPAVRTMASGESIAPRSAFEPAAPPAPRVLPGPPAAPGASAPMVASGVGPGSLSEDSLVEGGGTHLDGPPDANEAPPVKPSSEVLAASASRDVDTQARITFKPNPLYSSEGLQTGVQGTVLISVEFAADGTIRNPRVVRGLGHGLDESAIFAVRKIRFLPAMRDGVPVSVTNTIAVVFKLR